MSRFDGTGPSGEGPMTRCGRGYCVVPLNTPEQNLAFLRNQEQVIKQQLKNVKTRIKFIESRLGKKE